MLVLNSIENELLGVLKWTFFTFRLYKSNINNIITVMLHVVKDIKTIFVFGIL